jgi:excinuclease ABC subunit B
MYADKITKSIKACLEETKRRRKVQKKFNEENGITPETIKKSIDNILTSIYEADYVTVPADEKTAVHLSDENIPSIIEKLKIEMKEAAKNLEFEKAAKIRDEIKELTQIEIEIGL